MFPRLITRFLGARPVAHVTARPAARAKRAQNDSFFIPADLPPLDIYGLLSIEQRSEGARPAQLRTWIAEIDGQMPLMRPNDRDYASALLLKLQHLLDRAPLANRA